MDRPAGTGGEGPQARVRISANDGGPGPAPLAHSTPSPKGRLCFHNSMVYFSDSTDVSEGETEAQPHVGAEGLVPLSRVELWFLLFLPYSFSQLTPQTSPPVSSCTTYLVGLRVCAILAASSSSPAPPPGSESVDQDGKRPLTKGGSISF